MDTQIYEQRLAAGLALLDKIDCDCLLISSAENRRYLSGFTAREALLFESCGYLLISRYSSWLLTDFRYRDWAQQEVSHLEIRLYPQGLTKLLPELLQKIGCRKIGFESQYLSFNQYQRLSQAGQEAGLEITWQPQESLLEQLREIKDQGEIAIIRQALALTEKVLAQVATQLAPGQTEQEVARLLEHSFMEAGAEGLSFPTIVASGPNSARPHHHPGERVIRANEPIIIDLGARLQGYCADMTRTFYLGEPEARFKEIYGLVRQAQKTAEEGIRAGILSDAADGLAREVITTAGFGEYFGHSLGHGVGLAVHEGPTLSPIKEKSSLLQAGMVVTVEPGIYLPEWGGVRLEDMILIQAEGAEVLNGDSNFYRFD
jgi:Xaa-Pro aminopeptidase